MSAPAPVGRPVLRGNRNFTLLWVGQGASQLGSQITMVALPLVAVVTLSGSPLQVTSVVAAEYLPSLLIGLIGGVLVDRADQRRVMLVTDALRAVALVAVPVTAVLGLLSFPVLLAVAFVMGTATLFFDLAYQSGLPRIVESHALLAANGRLETTRAASTAVGPPAGSVLVQMVGAPFALVADAVSFAVSWVATFRLRLRPVPSRTPDPPGQYVRNLRADLVAGLSRVRRDPRQRAVIGVAATSNAATIVSTALLPLWLFGGLGLPVWTLGVVLAGGAAGAVVAGLVLGRLGRTDAPWRRIGVALVVAGAGLLLVPLAAGPPAVRVIMLCGAEAVLQGCVVMVAANAMAWRQGTTPQHLMAKVISVARTVNYGVLPVASLAGGALATAVGIRPVLFGTAALLAAAPLWLVGSTADPGLDASGAAGR